MGGERAVSLRSRAIRSFIAKPDLVYPDLVYPVTLTTDDASVSGGLAIVGNQLGPVGQRLLAVLDSTDAIRFASGITGGPYTVGRDIRAYNPAGTAYAALVGRTSYGCIELPDGASAQGPRVYGGYGDPNGVLSARSGDFFWRSPDLARFVPIAAAETTANGQAAVAVGTGAPGTANTTNIKDGTPLAGDLLVVVQGSTDATATLTVGSDSAITATGTDGGFTVTDGTRILRYWSRVVQSGDIASGQIVATSSALATGTGHSLKAMVFRHPGGLSTVGSKHGAAIHGSASDTAGGTSGTTLAVTGPATPSVAVAAQYATNTSATLALVWDGGSSSDTTADLASRGADLGAKPRILTANTSATPGYLTGGTSVVLTSSVASRSQGLGVWAAPVYPDLSNPTVYRCTGTTVWRTVIA